MSFNNTHESGRPVKIKDEGVTVTTNAASIDLAGAGVTASASGDEITATIPGATSIALNDLNDVTITSVASGQVLSYNGSAWVNSSETGLGTVTSVSVVSVNGISGIVDTATTTPSIRLDISGLDASKIADGTVSNTEFQYLNGVTSAVQTQLDAKAATALSNLASVAINTSLISDTDSTDSIGSTGVRWLKGWFDDMETTNMPTVGGTAILTSLTAPQFTTIELGHASENTLSAASGVLSIESVAIPTISSTSTLTNKRITQRVTTTTDDSTSVINIDTCDVYELSAVANNTEFTVTGTPTDGQKLIVRYKDAGVSKTLTWTFATAIGITLPSATTASKWGYVGCIYNSAASQWHAVAVTTQA